MATNKHHQEIYVVVPQKSNSYIISHLTGIIKFYASQSQVICEILCIHIFYQDTISVFLHSQYQALCTTY
jgi:hypothetical protein